MFEFKDERYNRQLNMPEWGAARQQQLSEARVAVIGAGGVKSTLLMSLVAAGIGHIKIIEYDKVELSNLNRQLLYRTDDIGKYKGECAIKTLTALNPDIDLSLEIDKIEQDNIDDHLHDWEYIVEGGDSPAARNLVNEYCLEKNKPMLHCSAQFCYGYLFNVLPMLQSACFACIFPNDHTRALHTGAVPVNVLATSISGTLGAAEILKWYLGYRENMIVNKKIFFNSLLLSGGFEEENYHRNENCPVCAKYYE